MGTQRHCIEYSKMLLPQSDKSMKSGSPTNSGMVQFWVAASSAAWGWQNSESGATIPKSFGFEAATPCETTTNVTRNLAYLNHAQTSGR